MSESVIAIEELDGGMKAAFINLPHFRTSALRLSINAGWLHEDEATAGAAHFLEHITFQGSEKFEDNEAVEDFTLKNGLYHNAFTNQTTTTFHAAGHDLNPALQLATQSALFPKLTPASLEKERKPVIEEIRSHHSDPFVVPSTRHRLAQAGAVYARDGLGSVDDIRAMTADNLRAFYDRHYKHANALLVICSGQSVETQRQLTMEALEGSASGKNLRPVLLNLPWFDAQPGNTSLQTVELPSTAQTYLTFHFEMPPAEDITETYMRNIACGALSRACHTRLRSELALVYSAGAYVYDLANLNFGAKELYSDLVVNTQLAGEDTINALQAIKTDVLSVKIPESIINFVLINAKNSMDFMLENTPQAMADNVIYTMQTYPTEGEINLEGVSDFVRNTSVDEMQDYIRYYTSGVPLITATSPDSKVLEDIGDWAAANY